MSGRSPGDRSPADRCGGRSAIIDGVSRRDSSDAPEESSPGSIRIAGECNLPGFWTVGRTGMMPGRPGLLVIALRSGGMGSNMRVQQDRCLRLGAPSSHVRRCHGQLEERIAVNAASGNFFPVHECNYANPISVPNGALPYDQRVACGERQGAGDGRAKSIASESGGQWPIVVQRPLRI